MNFQDINKIMKAFIYAKITKWFGLDCFVGIFMFGLGFFNFLNEEGR